MLIFGVQLQVSIFSGNAIWTLTKFVLSFLFIDLCDRKICIFDMKYRDIRKILYVMMFMTYNAWWKKRSKERVIIENKLRYRAGKSGRKCNTFLIVLGLISPGTIRVRGSIFATISSGFSSRRPTANVSPRHAEISYSPYV